MPLKVLGRNCQAEHLKVMHRWGQRVPLERQAIYSIGTLQSSEMPMSHEYPIPQPNLKTFISFTLLSFYWQFCHFAYLSSSSYLKPNIGLNKPNLELNWPNLETSQSQLTTRKTSHSLTDEDRNSKKISKVLLRILKWLMYVYLIFFTLDMIDQLNTQVMKQSFKVIVSLHRWEHCIHEEMIEVKEKQALQRLTLGKIKLKFQRNLPINQTNSSQLVLTPTAYSSVDRSKAT